MRYVNGLFCALLALFALVQYNDPDFIVWLAIYGIAAFWCGIAAFRTDTFRDSGTMRGAFWICFGLAALGTVYYWPTVWADWIHVEETREGIGMWIVMAGMIAAALGLRRRDAVSVTSA